MSMFDGFSLGYTWLGMAKFYAARDSYLED